MIVLNSACVWYLIDIGVLYIMCILYVNIDLFQPFIITKM